MTPKPRFTTAPMPRNVGTQVYADGILLGWYWPPLDELRTNAPHVPEVAPDCAVAHAEGRRIHAVPLLTAHPCRDHYATEEEAMEALLEALARPCREQVEIHDAERNPDPGIREAVQYARRVLEERHVRRVG